MIKIKNLGHSCFEFDLDGFKIITDPYQNGSVPNLKLPMNLEANFVHCSHNHADHNAKDLIKIVNKEYSFSFEEITVPHDDSNGTKRGFCTIFIIYYKNITLVHLGDIGCLPSTEVIDKIKNCDVLLSPINGYYTIGARELKTLVDCINPKIVIPMHYYKSYHNSGYPDGNQIELFKEFYPNYLEVNDLFDLSLDCPYKTAVIFK